MSNIKISPGRVFLFFSLSSVIFSFIWIMITKGAAWDTVLFPNWNDHFMDFYMHIHYVDSPSNVYYTYMHACFPAFAYMIYFALNRMVPSEYTVNDAHDIRYSQYGNIVFIVYMLFVTLIFIWMIGKYLKIKEGEKFGYCVAILFTVPFLYLFERGNIVYLVVVLLLLFLILYDSESRFKREIAIICLAAAAGLKIYPALFGFLYIKDKRYKEAIRAIIYGLIVFLVPFAFFGGIAGFKQFVSNLSQVNAVVWQEGCFNSLVHTTVLVGHKTGMATEKSVAIGKVISVIYFVVLLAAAYFQKSRWKTYALLSAIMIWFPMWSGSYTITYMCIPLLAFANECGCHKFRIIDYVYSVLFFGIFSFIAVNSEFCIKLCGYNLSITLRYVSMVLIVFIILGEQICNFFRTVREKRMV